MTTDWSKLKVVDLKAELKRRGLPHAGLKQELVNRLVGADAEPEPSTASDEKEPATEAIEAQEPAAEGLTDVVEKSEAKVTEVVGANESVPNGVSAPTQSGIEDTDKPEAVQERDVTPAAEPVQDSVASNSAEAAAADDAQTQREDTALSQAAPSELSAVASAEIQKDAQSRKRRSFSPPPLSQDVRKRMRYDSHEVPMPEVTREPEIPSTISEDNEQANGAGGGESVADMEMAEAPALSPPKTLGSQHEAEVKLQLEPSPRKTDGADAAYEQQTEEEAREPEHKPTDEGPSTSVVPPEQDDKEVERDVAPSIHPATAALYIKNFMRPLRPAAVQEYLEELATPRGQSPDGHLVLDFYLDQIRTHAFVVFASISAASRVRTALHEKIWPDESNRKALWVDYVPPDKVQGWVEVEVAEGGGRSGLSRWEVVYDRDNDGYISTRLEIAGPDSGRAAKAPTVPVVPRLSPPIKEEVLAAPSVPSGPSRSYAGLGVEGAPLGPRADRAGGRMTPGAGALSGDSWLRTRSVPVISYKPVSESLARQRIDNIHHYKSTDPKRDVGGQLNRYTFESGEFFVDRGKEVFIGIRPPHRERERQRELAAGFAPRRAIPPPAAAQARGDRYFGGRNDGAQRSRFDGAPLPTYNGPPRSGRWGRDNYRDRRY